MIGIKNILCSFIGLFLCMVSAFAVTGRAELNPRGVGHDGARIIGFTVIHGSAKAETAELRLMESVLALSDTLFYFPEMDMAMARYFNKYLAEGDDGLLKELVYDYRYKVPQEASVETFEKWRRIRELGQTKQIQVVGVDIPGSYLFSLRSIYDLFPENDPVREVVEAFFADPKTNYVIGADTPVRAFVDSLSTDYSANKNAYAERAGHSELLDEIFEGIETAYKVQAKGIRRDQAIALNYLAQRDKLGYRENYQFIRMGVYHMTKRSFKDMYSGFLAILVEEEGYSPDQLHVVMGLLCDSRVMGIRSYSPDMELEEVLPQAGDDWTGGNLAGVLGLLHYRVSDLTYVYLPELDEDGNNMEDFPWKPREGLVLSDYMDACILIFDSDGAHPVEKIM